MTFRIRGRALLLGGVVASAAALLWSLPFAAGQPAERLAAPNAVAKEVNYLGTASCASMACHNFNGADGDARSEYSTWANVDQHANAYQVLFNERSKRIIKNLGTPKPAHEDTLCLKCHATGDGKLDELGEHFQLADGVSCEACHGPAKKYLTEHYLRGFKEKSSKVKEDEYGLKDTKTLSKRAAMCISCHVGDASREVNHDLIAAGHPRLNFEMAGYHGIYKKHWSEIEETKRHKDYYARLWLIGQLATAKAAVDLLQVRAESADHANPEKRRPWPELAEYACYACHKDLQVDSPAQRSDYYKNRHPGSFPFGTWYLSAVPTLAGDPGYIPAKLIDDLNKMRALMEQPGPSAKLVASQAAVASATLAEAMRKLDGGELKDTRIRALLGKYMDGWEKKAGELTWDESTQHYLAVTALAQGLTGLKSPTFVEGKGRDQLLAVKKRLKGAFPAGFDSPKGYDPLANPKTGLPSLADQIKALRSQMGN